jgi:hypothetical protein
MLGAPDARCAMQAPRVPQRLSARAPRSSAAAAYPPSSAPLADQGPHGGLEIVWDGPKPRMRRKLHMASTSAEPDFAAAASRAEATALRLGLPRPPPRKTGAITSAAGAPQLATAVRAGTTSAMPSAGPSRPLSGFSSSHGASSRSVSRASAAPRHEPWLADEEPLSRQLRDLDRYVSVEGPDAVRKLQKPLAASWHQPTLVVDVPRLHLQTPAVALEAVLATHEERYAAASAADRLADRSMEAARWRKQPLGETW